MNLLKMCKTIVFLFLMAPFLTGCAGMTTEQKPLQAASSEVDSQAASQVDSAHHKAEPAKIKKTTPKPPQKTERIRSGEFELVETPFGLMKRRAKKIPQADQTQVPSSDISAPEKVIKGESQSAQGEPPPEKGGILLNFDNADLDEVIRTLADILNLNYIIDEKVRGTVTIHTAARLQQTDLLPAFYQILEVNHLTAIKEGSFLRITPSKNASKMSLTSGYGRDADDIPPGQQIIMQIIPLHYIDVAEMTKLLQPFISPEGTIISHQDSKTLLLVDKGVNIAKALRLIEVFDVNLFDNVQHHFYTMTNVDATEGVKILSSILEGYGVLGKDGIQLIAMERLNMILAISANPSLLDKITPFIQQIDIPSEGIEPRIYVYSVKNGEAQELSGLLNQIFTNGGDSAGKTKLDAIQNSPDVGEKPSAPAPLNPFLIKPAETKNDKIKTTRAVREQLAGSGTLSHDIKIIPDVIRNAMIIEAVPADYRVIEAILTDLDILARQVLIEVTIAEIKLDDSFELGLDWNFQDPATPPVAHSSWGSIASSGLQYFISETGKWQGKLSTLASKNKVNILSAPSLLASDNKEAKINISTEVPVASTLYQNTKDADPLLQTNIQYRNTGVILSVTPHINERGLVSMEINQEVSEQSDPVVVGKESLPSFFKRSVNTTLTVQHGQTIVIGGLIRESRTKGGTGVPYLRDIPLVGYLFGTESDIKAKTEMIILITPRVIASLEDVDLVTEEFQNKLSNVKKGIF